MLCVGFQVTDVLGNSSTLQMVEPQVEFSQIIQKSCEHLCIDWLKEELSLKSSNTDVVLSKLANLSSHCAANRLLCVITIIEVMIKISDLLVATSLKVNFCFPLSISQGRLSVLGDKLNVYDSIIQSIEILGKKDLYADLIGILRFGSLR